MSVSVLPASMYVYHLPGTQLAIYGREPPCRYWEPNPGLQEQHVLLTTELTLQHPRIYFRHLDQNTPQKQDFSESPDCPQTSPVSATQVLGLKACLTMSQPEATINKRKHLFY